MDPYAIGLLPRDDPGSIICQTERAPDYYGLGVRLGIYFAWLQAYIANTILPAEIAGALDTNTIFLLTLLIAMGNCSRVGMLKQVDGLILMHLSGGTIFGILSLWGYRTRRYIDSGPRAIRFFGGYGTHFRMLVSLGVSVYGLWYWLRGVTGDLAPMLPDDNPPNPIECSTLYTFFFAKVRADGGIRGFYIFICSSCVLYFGCMVIASSIAIYEKLKGSVQEVTGKEWAGPTRLRFATGLKYKELSLIHKFLRVANFIWLVWSVLLVECTLNFNNMTGVLGGIPQGYELHLPGQLLPLLIGACGFLRISYLAYQKIMYPELESPLTAPNTPRTPRVMSFGPEITAVYTGGTAREAERDPHETDELVRKWSLPLRYLVSYLPWLSLLSYFRDDSGHVNTGFTQYSYEADDKIQIGQKGSGLKSGGSKLAVHGTQGSDSESSAKIA